MRAFAFACAVVGVGTALPAAALAAPAAPKNVKVCVRIEEKSWTREPETPPVKPVPAPSPGNASVPVPDGAASEPPVAYSDASPTSPARAAPEAAPDGAGVAPPLPVAEPTLQPPREPIPAPAPASGDLADGEADFFSVDPDLYLHRLVEYHVTHEPGFEAVKDGCSQTLTVELYPVAHGWTVFARYTGSAREEKVDVVRLDELGTFAERVTTALLRDKSISETLTRTTVLRADSEARVRQIKTRTHLLLGLGSNVRVGRLPTAPNSTDPAEERLRIETPLGFALGARNKFRAWALDGTARLDVGFTQRASRRSAGGGHVDYSAGVGLGLGFLAYANPDAVNTLYYGGGGSFQVSRYQSLGRVGADGSQPTPDGLWGGGLNVEGTLGYEFMRTSTLHFFVQATVSAPAYVFESENDQSRIQSYIPSANAQVGLLF